MRGDRELAVLLPPSLGKTKATARAELLADELTQRLAVQVSVQVADSYGHLASEAAADRVDLVWAPPRLRQELAARAQVVLTCVRADGPAEYCSALLARTGEVREPSDLQGMRAAWVDRESTGGYRLVTEMLRHEGMSPSRLFSSQRFSGSYRDAAMAVIRGDADLCAIFTQSPDRKAVSRSLEEVVGALGERLEPVAFTPPTCADAFLITGRPDPELAERVAELLASRRCPRILLESCNAERLERA